MRNDSSWLRRSTAVALSLLLTPLAQISLNAQAPPPGGYTALDAVQLDQMVAPIALYPDALVAQMLTAATFPDQVRDANNWVHRNGGMPPDQMSAAVNNMQWDPSVKALTAFPAVLDNMTRNYRWTEALGNAYYNQPGDVMNAVQAMRFQAQQAGTLRTSPQERVVYEGGLVVIEPVNPGMVYVPYYNPWSVWGTPIAPWSGFFWGPPRGVALGAGVAIGFGVGIGIGLFAHYGWGYNAWAPNWHGGVVVYNHNTYISRSVTVVNHGHFAAYNRGVFEHPGRGVPAGAFHPAVTAQTAAFAHSPAGGSDRPPAAMAGRPGAPGSHRPAPGNATHPEAAKAAHPPANENRPPVARAAHPPAPVAHRAAPQASRAPAKPAPKAPPKNEERKEK